MNMLPAERVSARDKIPAEVRNVRTFRGMDGNGYNAVLYVNGKRAADVLDEGSGGGTWLRRPYHDPAAVAALEAAVLALPPEPSQYGPLAMTMDLFLGLLCEDAIEATRLARLAKKNTLYRTPDMARGEWVKVNRPDSPEMREWVRAKAPNAVFYEAPVKAPRRAASRAKARR